MSLNIAVIGIGGVGGFYGGKLTSHPRRPDAPGVHFVARGDHLREMRVNGLTLDSEEGILECHPTSATDRVEDLRDIDLFLLCVKGYQLDQALKGISGSVSERTMVLPLMNGVDIRERIRGRIRTGTVFPSCVYLGSNLQGPGLVRQRGPSMIHFGPDPDSSYMDPAIFRTFDEAGIQYNWTEDPTAEIWKKFMFVAPFGLVTAISDRTIREVAQSKDLKDQVRGIMEEIEHIARKKGIDLPSTIIDDSIEKAKSFPPEIRTSFQRDFDTPGKPDERDIFGGTILRMGKDLGIPTDNTERTMGSIDRMKGPI